MPNELLQGIIAPNSPNIFFAISSGFAAALTLLLPETRGKELPDFAKEVPDVDNDEPNMEDDPVN
jgi:hypothetical protein